MNTQCIIKKYIYIFYSIFLKLIPQQSEEIIY
jgi:hypothetical protein